MMPELICSSSAKENAVGKCLCVALSPPHPLGKNLGAGSSHKLYLFYDYDHAKALLISHETAKESPSGGAQGRLPAGFLSLCVCLGMAQLSIVGGSTGSPGSTHPGQHPPLCTPRLVLLFLSSLYFCSHPLPHQIWDFALPAEHQLTENPGQVLSRGP